VESQMKTKTKHRSRARKIGDKMREMLDTNPKNYRPVYTTDKIGNVHVRYEPQTKP